MTIFTLCSKIVLVNLDGSFSQTGQLSLLVVKQHVKSIGGRNAETVKLIKSSLRQISKYTFWPQNKVFRRNEQVFAQNIKFQKISKQMYFWKKMDQVLTDCI